jgi:hypothetical protein
MDLITGLLWAFVGAVMSQLVYLLYELFGQIRMPVNLFGEWYSTWQPTTEPGWDWVEETVTIRRSIFGIRLINDNNSKGYVWQGKGKLIHKKYLVGEWASRRPGSNAEGIFALTFESDGRCLLGYFMSRDVNRRKIISGFVLARTKEEMINGRKRLIAMRPQFPGTK